MGYYDVALRGAEILNNGLRKYGKSFSTKCLQPTLKKSDLIGIKYTPNLEGDVIQLPKAKQVFEEFKPVNTIEEATQRAIHEYGLAAFDIKNLDVANDALYVLHKIKCKSTTQLGITSIVEKPILRNDPSIAARIYPNTGEMEIARCGLITATSNRISSMAQQVPGNKINEYTELLRKMSNGEIPMFQLTQDMEKLGLKATCIGELPFQTLIHEQGHRAHFLTVQEKELYWKMGKFEEIKNAGITDFSLYEEFMSKEIQNIIKSWSFLGSYARTSPCEFVAEVYSALIHDVKVPENIMKLYYKYHGPKVL